MLSRMKKVICGVAAAALMAAMSVTAFADHIYQLEGEDGLCDEIKAVSYEIYGTEGRFEGDFGDSTEEKYISLRFKLFNEYLDNDFWNSDDARVSVDVKLETEGKDLIACIPGFTNKWGWVNPSDYTQLKAGEWITVTEKASHFYEEFSKAQPAYLLLQVRTNWGAPAQGSATIAVRNFRIINGKSEVTTADTTTTAPEETTTVPEDTSTTPEQTTAPIEITETNEPATTLDNEGATGDTPEQSATDQAASENGTADAAVTDKPDDTSTPEETTAVTTIRTAATEATSAAINYGELYAEPESPVTMILVIVGVAVVIVAGAVVGYLIYRKKKYY